MIVQFKTRDDTYIPLCVHCRKEIKGVDLECLEYHLAYAIPLICFDCETPFAADEIPPQLDITLMGKVWVQTDRYAWRSAKQMCDRLSGPVAVCLSSITKVNAFKPKLHLLGSRKNGNNK